MTPAPPSPTTWWDYAKAIPNDAPDTVYDSAREHFFRTVVEPKALQDGYDTALARQGFWQQSERPNKAAFPRAELVGKEALAAFATPLVNMMGGDSGNLQRGVERSREEAARQGINKPLPVIGGPYSFVGQAAGMLPYFAAGELAAAPLLAGAESVGAGLLLKEGMHAATIGAVQGSYDAAVAPEGKKAEAFGHGAAMGTAIGAGFGLLGGLSGALREAHPDITPKEAAALDSVAKGVASPEELDLATAATFKTTKLEDTVQQVAAEGQKAANSMGVPKEVKLEAEVPPEPSLSDTLAAVPSSNNARVGGQRVKINMIGADGKPYTLGGAKGLPIADMEANLELITQHLKQGGSIVELGGQKKAIQTFLRKVELSNAPDEVKLPIKQAIPGAAPAAKPATVPISLDYKPNMLIRQFLEANPDTTVAELEENFSLQPGKAQKAFDWWQGEREDVEPRAAARRPNAETAAMRDMDWADMSQPGSWISPEGEMHPLGKDTHTSFMKAFGLKVDDALYEYGWARHRGNGLEVKSLDTPQLAPALYEAAKYGDTVELDYGTQLDNHLSIPREDFGEFLSNPRKYARAQRPRASRTAYSNYGEDHTDLPGSWISPKGKIEQLDSMGQTHGETAAGQAIDYGRRFKSGWIRHRYDALNLADLDNPQLPQAMYEASKYADTVHIEYGSPEYGKSRYVRVPKADIGEFLADPKKYARQYNGRDYRFSRTSRIDDVINSRDSYYHATSVEGAHGILDSGEVAPGGDPLNNMVDQANYWLEDQLGKEAPSGPYPGAPKQAKLDYIQIAKDMGWDGGVVDTNAGVSVSRVPRVASKADKGITFVIDRKGMPKNRPFTEPAYEKSKLVFSEPTDSNYSSLGVNEVKARVPNETFEFEQRTYNEPISLKHVKGVLLDEEAINQLDHPADKTKILDLLKRLDNAKIPYKWLDSGRDVHSYRAGLSQAEEGMRWAVTRDSIPEYDNYQQLPTGEVLYKPTGEVFDSLEDALYESALDNLPAQEPGPDIDLNNYDEANKPAYDFSKHQEPTPRHALIAGSGNIPLSLKGRQQAIELGERVAARGGLDELHQSNIPAADQTAQAILQTNPLTKANMPSPELDGWSLASMEGQEYDHNMREAIQTTQMPEHAHKFWVEGGPRSTRQIGESYRDFSERVSKSLYALEQSYKDNPRKIGVVVTPDVIEQFHAGMVDKSFNGHYDGVFRYAPDEQGNWQVRRVDMAAESQLRDGIYLIAHTETPYSKSAQVQVSKTTPLGQRSVGPQKILTDYKAQGLAIGKNIYLRDSLNRGVLAHERYHALTYALRMNDDVMNLMDHPETNAIYDSGFSPVSKEFYGLDPAAWREEVYAHSLDAIRTNNETKIQKFIDADTSREVYLGWFRDMTQAHLDVAATRADSIAKRMYERALNDASNRATRHLADINNYFSQEGPQLSLRDGHYITEEDGVTILHNSREAALRHLEEQEPSLNVPELVDTSLLNEAVPRFSRRERPPDGKAPGNADPTPFELGEPRQMEGGLQLASRFFRPFTGWLNTVATRNNWPELFDTFSQIDNAHIAYNNLTRPYINLLKETIGQASPKRQQDFYKWFETPTKEGRARVEEALQFTDGEKEMLSRFKEEVLAPLSNELGVDLSEYVHTILPKIKAAGSIKEAFPRQKGTNYNFMIEKLRTGGLDPKNENLLWLAGKYLEYGAKAKTLKPAIDAAEKLMYERLEDGSMRAGNVLPLLQRHIDFQRGVPDYTNQIVKGALEGAAELINRGLEVVNEKLPKSMQIPTIGELSNGDPLGKFTLFQYAGTLGLKPATVIRDAMQYFITTLPVAGKYALRGMQRVYPAFRIGSEEARNLWDTASRYGALIERNDLTSLYAAAEDITTQTGEKSMANFAAWTMKAIQLSHNSNRLAAFWGHTEQAMDAITSWRRHGDLKRFSKDSGLWFLDKGIREQFLTELPTLKDPTDFTHRVAARLTEATQWNFRRGANPGMYETSLGRLFGQYGTWPLNYIEYARKFAAAEDKVASREGLTRLVLAHGAILAAGQSLGIDTGRWTFAAPATDWSGGPLVQHLLNAPKLFDIETKEGDEARHELRRDIFPGLIPGGVEAGRLYEAIVGDDPDGWVKTLGFHVMDNGDYNRGLHQLLPGEK